MGIFPGFAAVAAVAIVVGGISYESSHHFNTSPIKQVTTASNQTNNSNKTRTSTVAKVDIKAKQINAKIGDTVTIQGTAVNSQGQGIPNAKLTVIGTPNHTGSYSIQTDAAGNFQIQSVWNHAGQYTVHVGEGLASNSVTVNVAGVTTSGNGTSSSNLGASKPAKVQLSVTPNPAKVGEVVTIHVKLLTANGQGAPNATFSLNVPNNLNYATEQTDANGNFTTTVKWNTPGTYLISAGNGKIAWQTSVTVK